MYSPLVEQYLKEHNVNLDTAQDCSYWYETEDGICFVLDSGTQREHHAFTLRHIPALKLFNGKVLRWENPKDVTLGSFVFFPWELTEAEVPFIRYPHALVIVEGPTDALRLWSAGVMAVATIGVDIAKKTQVIVYLSHMIEELMARDVLLYHIPDNDGPGVALQATISTHFPSTTIIRLPEGKKDVSECDDKELPWLLKQMEP